MKYHYAFTRKQAVKSILYGMIATVLIVGLLAASNDNRVYVQFTGYGGLIGIFAYKYFFFQKKLKEKIYISLNATKCLKMFEQLILGLAGIVVFGFFICIIDRRAWNEYLIMWQFVLLFIIYLIALFYPFVVVFGKNSYVSGSFEMSYAEIEKIDDIKTYDIMGTEMIKCEIVTRDGKNCKETFTEDEYQFLHSLCQERNGNEMRMGGR